ncbi:MAG: c-type cytochrome [Halobacteriovoraceae bacterium]|nr:c-type cytochrome [Halobacteriovoraceae bacterium]
MPRLVILLGLLSVLICLFSLSRYKSSKISNEPFNYQKEKKEYAEYIKRTTFKPKVKIVKKIEPPKEKKKPTVVLDTPILQNGHRVYTKIGKCTTCHGKYGEGRRSQKAPKIAGQYAWYNANALIAMKKKKRINKIMNPYLKKLSIKDLQDVAAYLEKLPWNQ